ncbi:MAG: hypothetical protein WDW38_009009 [Sanguina aurantia]
MSGTLTRAPSRPVQAEHDFILYVSELYRADPHPEKVDLGVGAYRTEEGKPLILQVVKAAEQRMLEDPNATKEYPPITGIPAFCDASQRLAFGEGSSALRERRVVTAQALSGTGALRLGAELLSQFYPVRTVYFSNPTWAGHRPIFTPTGMQLRQYRYFDAVTKGLDFEGMITDLQAAADGAIVVLHVCAHNPSGVDPSQEQWRQILAVVLAKKLLPFFDFAYQGFASGDMEKDAYALRLFADTGMRLLLSQSYSKNMGLYGERTGALSVVCGSPEAAQRVQGQLKLIIRSIYSCPPRHGATIAATVMTDPLLCARWQVELKAMAERVLAMRACLHAALIAKQAPGDWSFIVKQVGMFSYTGLSAAQCQHLIAKWHVYLPPDGRISMAGLSAKTCPYLAGAIIDALAMVPNPSV